MRKRNLWAACAAILAASTLAACGQEEVSSVNADEKAGTETVSVSKDTVQGDFDTAMICAMARGQEGSFVFSPYSIKDCLTLAYDGMSDEAKGVLEEKGISEESVKAMAAFDERAKDLDCINVANRLYVNKERAAEYNTDLIRKDGMEEVQMNSDTADRINAWIAEQTHDRIQNLINGDLITEDTVLVPVNAVWMKLSWLNQFEEESISWKEDGSQREGFSGTIDPTDVKETENGYIIRLAYMPEYGEEGKEGDEPLRVSMYLFLDKDDDDGSKIRSDVEKGELDLQSLENFSENYAGLSDCTEVMIHMPDFRTEYRGDVTETLDDIGLGDILNKEAYEKIGDMEMSSVMHGAFIDTDRNGTEAAAATAGIASATAAVSEPVIRDIYVDHPFAWVIRDDAEGGQILFEGITAGDCLSE